MPYNRDVRGANAGTTPNIPILHTDTTTYGAAGAASGVDIVKNWFVQTMTNKVIQVGVIRSVKDNNKYNDYFDDNRTRQEGRSIEYLFPQAKEGLIAKKDLSVHVAASGFIRENEIPFVRLKKFIDHVYYDIIVEDRLLEGLANEGLLGEIIDEIKGGIGRKIRRDLARGVENIICDENNYCQMKAENAGNRATVHQYNGITYPNGTGNYPAFDGDAPFYAFGFRQGNLFNYKRAWFETPTNVITDLWNVSSLFLVENERFQKGFNIKALETDATTDADWVTIPADVESLEDIHLIIDYDIDNGLVLGEYKTTQNWELIDIRRRFGKVTPTKLKNGFMIFMFDKEALKIHLKGKYKDKGLEHKYEPENGANWFFAKPQAHGGILTCLNYAAWRIADPVSV